MSWLRTLRAESDRLKASMTRLRETEAERDRLREALEETKEELKVALKENRSLSRHRPGK
ncbi:hypothetical protein [Streptomyces sp. B3I8]|uniref:hypothetical protein n=1 Tax=Streptomyces sp. B3I8 TaxID=3042303 RepID=UPI002789E6C8|nr:hypothetical protein [Streptomyces sp. B3I8]MDQ0787910.1 chromosome segregation ATPase [Streptomyces sp. B3I8]